MSFIGCPTHELLLLLLLPSSFSPSSFSLTPSTLLHLLILFPLPSPPTLPFSPPYSFSFSSHPSPPSPSSYLSSFSLTPSTLLLLLLLLFLPSLSPPSSLLLLHLLLLLPFLLHYSFSSSFSSSLLILLTSSYSSSYSSSSSSPILPMQCLHYIYIYILHRRGVHVRVLVPDCVNKSR